MSTKERKGHADGRGQGHSHVHAHGHDHDGGSERRVLYALLLTGAFMVAEVVGGLLSGSLALLADAGHMLTDTAALALSWFAFRVSRRPAHSRRSYGHARFQVLAAMINGGALFAITIWIVVEAVRRLLEPADVLGGAMLIVAALGLAVNVAAVAILHGGDQDNLNIRGALLHVLGDLLGSVAAIAAALVIMWSGWTPIDPILSVLVALLILRSAWMLVAQSWHVLMEGAPEGLDLDAMVAGLRAESPDVLDIHHVHAWSLTPDKPLLTMHARISETANADAVLRHLVALLKERFGIAHATIQIERDVCADHARTHKMI